MKRFAHASATTVEEVISALGPKCRPIGGGIDLLHLMKAGLAAPESLVSVRTVADLGGVEETEQGLRIGSATTLARLADHPALSREPALACLAEALARTASPQIRNMATIGGNLLQTPRCWYFRNNLIPCWLKGGQRCFAVRGENKYHAILGRGPCQAVHPSDPAVALAALGASVGVWGPDGIRTSPVGSLFQTPRRDARSQTTLGVREVLLDVTVPPQDPGCQSVFVKVSERSALDFALASVAVWAEKEGDRVRQARVILGGVAPMPWHAEQAEDVLAGNVLSGAIIGHAAEAATDGSRPLEHNAYKVAMVQGAVRQALRALGGAYQV